MRLYIGIDPGITGAVAVLDHTGIIRGLFDTPTVMLDVSKSRKVKKRKKIYNKSGMAKLLAFNKEHTITVVYEDVHAMPGEGAVGAFSFGRGLGLWEGILAAYGIESVKVSPQRWKGTMMPDAPKEKDASRVIALQIWPNADLKLKKHHGRADALLIAEYLRRTNCDIA